MGYLSDSTEIYKLCLRNPCHTLNHFAIYPLDAMGGFAQSQAFFQNSSLQLFAVETSSALVLNIGFRASGGRIVLPSAPLLHPGSNNRLPLGN